MEPHPLLEAAWGPRFTHHRLTGEHAPAFNNGYPPLTTGTCWGFAMAHLRLAALARYAPNEPAPTPSAARALLHACVDERMPTRLPGVACLRELSLHPAWRPALQSTVNALWARRFFNPRNLGVVTVNTHGGNLACVRELARRLETADRPLLQLQPSVFHQHVVITWRVDVLPDGWRVCFVDSNHHASPHGPRMWLEVDMQGRVRMPAPGALDEEAGSPSGFSRVAGMGLRVAPGSGEEARGVIRALSKAAPTS